MKRRNGFTAVEFVVVILIIGVLAAILFPVFGRAREKARLAGCEGNLKQMMLACSLYRNDYDGKLPGVYTKDGVTDWNTSPLWRAVEAGYTGVGKAWVLECTTAVSNTIPTIENFPQTSYGVRLDLCGFDAGTLAAAPSRTPYIFDTQNCPLWVQSPSLDMGWYKSKPELDLLAYEEGKWTKLRAHHLKEDYVNVAFVDGHVKAYVAGSPGKSEVEENFFRSDVWKAGVRMQEKPAAVPPPPVEAKPVVAIPTGLRPGTYDAKVVVDEKGNMTTTIISPPR